MKTSIASQDFSYAMNQEVTANEKHSDKELANWIRAGHAEAINDFETAVAPAKKERATKTRK